MIQLAALIGSLGPGPTGKAGGAAVAGPENGEFASFLSGGAAPLPGVVVDLSIVPTAAFPGPVAVLAAATGKILPPSGNAVPLEPADGEQTGAKPTQDPEAGSKDRRGARLAAQSAILRDGAPRPPVQARPRVQAANEAEMAEPPLPEATPSQLTVDGGLAAQTVEATLVVPVMADSAAVTNSDQHGRPTLPDEAAPAAAIPVRQPAQKPAGIAAIPARLAHVAGNALTQERSLPAPSAPAPELAVTADQAPSPAALAAVLREAPEAAGNGAVTVRPAAAGREEARPSRTRLPGPPAEGLPASAAICTPAEAVTVSGAIPVPPPAPAADAPRDFSALVDRLMAAREAADPRGIEVSVQHAEFGEVSLRFEQGDGGLSVSLASPDPEFARAVEAASAVSPGTADSGPRDGSPASPSGQALSGRGDNGFAQSGGRPAHHTPEPASARDHSSRARDDEAPSPPTRGDQPRRGILA